MNSGIYIIEFPDGSFYVGQSVHLANRWFSHTKSFKNSTAASKLQQAYIDNSSVATFKVLLKCHPDYLNMFEAYFIHTMQPSLNTTKPSASKYDWDLVASLVPHSELMDSIEVASAAHCETRIDLSIAKFKNNDLERKLESVSTIAEAQETRAIELEKLLEEPDVVKALMSDLKTITQAKDIIHEGYWGLHQRIADYNNKNWWRRLWTKV